MDLNLHKLSELFYALILLLIVGIAGGFLFLAIYFRLFFTQADNYKLTILSIGISVPIYVFNAFLAAYDRKGKTLFGKSGMLLTSLIGATLFSLPILYLPTVLGFFFRLNSMVGVSIALLLEAIIGTLCFLSDMNN